MLHLIKEMDIDNSEQFVLLKKWNDRLICLKQNLKTKNPNPNLKFGFAAKRAIRYRTISPSSKILADESFVLTWAS